MKKVNLGVGEMGIASETGTALQTIGLGSCVAVIILDPFQKKVGMVHVALPDSLTDPDRARRTPGFFADTAIPALLERMGLLSRTIGLMAKLAGGASVMDSNGTFNIGKRNVLAIKKLLWKHRIAILGEDIGGTHSRSVIVDVDEGRVVVTGPEQLHHEI